MMPQARDQGPRPAAEVQHGGQDLRSVQGGQGPPPHISRIESTYSTTHDTSSS